MFMRNAARRLERAIPPVTIHFRPFTQPTLQAQAVTPKPPRQQNLPRPEVGQTFQDYALAGMGADAALARFDEGIAGLANHRVYKHDAFVTLNERLSNNTLHARNFASFRDYMLAIFHLKALVHAEHGESPDTDQDLVNALNNIGKARFNLEPITLEAAYRRMTIDRSAFRDYERAVCGVAICRSHGTSVFVALELNQTSDGRDGVSAQACSILKNHFGWQPQARPQAVRDRLRDVRLQATTAPWAERFTMAMKELADREALLLDAMNVDLKHPHPAR